MDSLEEKAMMSTRAAILALCAVGSCAAQTSTTATQPVQNAVKHFRLIFVLSYPETQQPSQSFALDIPVTKSRPGESIMGVAAGSSGQEEGRVRESLQCTNVHQSVTGLAAKVSFAMNSVSPEALPGSTEAVHHNLTFEQQIDVALGTPTLITRPMHRIPLKKGDEVYAKSLPEAPQITVTATEI
jgi:hypothetical protein